jgi:hypothetical protein
MSFDSDMMPQCLSEKKEASDSVDEGESEDTEAEKM